MEVTLTVPPQGLLIAPAPVQETVVKALETPYASYAVMKGAPERRFTLGLAYPAMKPDASKAADGHIDFVSAEVLEKTAHEWLFKHRDVNLFHWTTRPDTSPRRSRTSGGHPTGISSPVDGQPYVIKSGTGFLAATGRAGMGTGEGRSRQWLVARGTARRSTPTPSAWLSCAPDSCATASPVGSCSAARWRWLCPHASGTGCSSDGGGSRPSGRTPPGRDRDGPLDSPRGSPPRRLHKLCGGEYFHLGW